MRLPSRSVRTSGAFVAGALLFAATAACRRSTPQPETASASELTIGYGLTSGQNAETGIRQAMNIIARDPLIVFASDGRPQPRLIAGWKSADQGLEYHLFLRPDVRFHDGTPLTAQLLGRLLSDRLRRLGAVFEDIAAIDTQADGSLRVRLRRPSSFLIEALDFAVAAPATDVGAGPFAPESEARGEMAMTANPRYYAGAPVVDRIVFRPFTSVRSAWAEMLRGDLDMLWEVGVDALDFVKSSSKVHVFTHQRNYAYGVVFNMRRSAWRASSIRQQLNAAVDRDALINKALGGRGKPADTALWPYHWAADTSAPKFSYSPRPLPEHFKMSCIFADASLEPLALSLQSQLHQVRVDLQPELLPIDEWYRRVEAGTFDTMLADLLIGPNLLRQYDFWRTGGATNWGHYSSAAVDAALDSIRHAANDDEYKAGVAAFQRAIVDDPPAIFLAWSERARAVSTRFEVPVEPGRDILSTLRLWRPVAGARQPDRN